MTELTIAGQGDQGNIGEWVSNIDYHTPGISCRALRVSMLALLCKGRWYAMDRGSLPVKRAEGELLVCRT